MFGWAASFIVVGLLFVPLLVYLRESQVRKVLLQVATVNSRKLWLHQLEGKHSYQKANQMFLTTWTLLCRTLTLLRSPIRGYWAYSLRSALPARLQAIAAVLCLEIALNFRDGADRV